MNANVTFQVVPTVDDFHTLRSQCLDSFAAIEEAIVGKLTLHGLSAGQACLSQKVEALRAVKASPQYAKVKVAAVHAILDQIVSLIEQRNDIVHAQLGMAVVGDDYKACFINARQATCGSQIARLYSLQNLRELKLEARKLAEQLRQA